MTYEQQVEAEKILLDCATQYYVASGLVPDLDGQEGYGPLRAARVFIEAYGSEASRVELAKWRRRS